MKTLYLEKRGCDFYGAKETELSNVGNYRVTTTDYTVKGKDGNTYFLEFTQRPPIRYRRTNLRTGKPLKHAKAEFVYDNSMIVSPQFIDAEGSCWGNCRLQGQLASRGFEYTLAGILAAVNYLSADHYDSIEFVERT